MNSETKMAFENAEEKMRDVIESLEELKDIMKQDESEIVRGYTNQLDAYTIPWIEAFISGRYQSGALHRMLDGIEKEEKNKEDE